MKPIRSIDDPRYVKAMSHPLRVRILAMLGERRASPNQLAGWLGVNLGTVAYHVRSLERAGLIELVDETRVRGAIEHHYRAADRIQISDDAWAQASPVAKQAAVGSSMQVIDEYVRAAAAAGGFDRADAHVSRRVMNLDAQGFAELSQACRELLQRAAEIEAAAAERIDPAAHAEDVVDAGLSVLLFEAARLTDGDARPTGPSARRGRHRRAAAGRSG